MKYVPRLLVPKLMEQIHLGITTNTTVSTQCFNYDSTSIYINYLLDTNWGSRLLDYAICAQRDPDIRGPGEWGSGLLTEVIAPQRDPRLQLQRPGEEVGKRNPH